MRKIIIIMTALVIFGTIAYAEIIDGASVTNESEDRYSLYTDNQIEDVQDVGNGYLVTNTADSVRYFTEDFVSYRAVNVYDDKESFSGSGSRFGSPGSMDEIIWADGVYMARSTTYDNIGKSPSTLSAVRYLYILNTDFGLLQKIEFNNYVREMSYVDGVYYVCVNNKTDAYKNSKDIVNEVYSSTDLEQWTLRSELDNVPIKNGNIAVVLKDLNIYSFENDSIGSQILFENVQISNASNPYSNTENQNILNVAGEYFYITDNVSNEYGNYYSWISVDGIYYTKFLGTYTFKNGGSVLFTSDSDNSAYIYKVDLNEKLKTGDVYVKFNDYILSFEEPPVIENGTTLIPIRFLFEQMGAEVDWDSDTQTASISKDGTVITFTIDNTTATVNGEPTEMTVPAQLINDKTMVPVRFLSEELGYTVTWDGDNRIITIE